MGTSFRNATCLFVPFLRSSCHLSVTQRKMWSCGFKTGHDMLRGQMIDEHISLVTVRVYWCLSNHLSHTAFCLTLNSKSSRYQVIEEYHRMSIEFDLLAWDSFPGRLNPSSKCLVLRVPAHSPENFRILDTRIIWMSLPTVKQKATFL